MGASIWLIVLVPIWLVISLFGNFYTQITGKTQAEISLPYDESKGLVWEYDNNEDYYVDFVEVKIEDDEQIFVFKDNDAEPQKDKTGRCMDLVFTDKNGNQKIYYANFAAFGELIFYEESECLITEYTAVVHNPKEEYYWVSDGSKKDRVFIQPISKGDEVTFTVVCMPDDIEKLKAKENYAFNVSFGYVNKNGSFKENVTVVYELVDGKLEVKDELWTIVHDEK